MHGQAAGHRHGGPQRWTATVAGAVSTLAGSPYGQTREPEPPPGANVFRGQELAAWPTVVALPFPMSARVRPGVSVPDTFEVRPASAPEFRFLTPLKSPAPKRYYCYE